MIGRFIGAAILFVFVGYATWWIAWYSGTQSGNGSSLPEPPYANVISGQAAR